MRSLDEDVRLTIYRFFAERGRAPVPGEVAEMVSRTTVEVEDSFRRLHDAHLLVLAPGTPYIWMANPFSALPTPYVVESDDRTFWGNCVWDALGILALLGSDGRVVTRCPDCNEGLTLEVREGALAPSDHVIHFAVPAAKWWDDIGFN